MKVSFVIIVISTMAPMQRIWGQSKTVDIGSIKTLLQKHSCVACHHVDKRLVGPPFVEISKRGYAREKIADLILKPEPTNWPQYTPMPILENISREDAYALGEWISSIQKELSPAKPSKRSSP